MARLDSVESDGLVAEIVERAHKQARAAQQQDTERDLRANGQLAESLRSLGGGSGILAQRAAQDQGGESERQARC